MPIPSMPLSVRSRNVTTGRLRPASSGMLASGSSSGMARVVASKLEIFMTVSSFLRMVQFGARPCDSAHAALEDDEWRSVFRDRLLGGESVDHHDIGGITNSDAVVFQIHQSGRPLGQHGKALAQPMRVTDLANIGLQI